MLAVASVPLPKWLAVALSSDSVVAASHCWATLLGYGLLVALLVELLVILFEPFQRWKLRHLPGPPAYPLVGCVPDIMRLGSHEFFRACYEKYGPVYKVALGRAWAVVVGDAELMRQVGVKLRNHIVIDPNLLRGSLRKIELSGLFMAKDDYWRLVRSAWQPAFSAASLSGYLPRMVACAVQLTDRLETRAREAEVEGGSGKAGGRVDIWRELGSMTLQVVGSTAYGVDFLAMGEPTAAAEGHVKQAAAAGEENSSTAAADSNSSSSSAYSRELVQACADVFRFSNAYHGSRYAQITMLLPELRPLLSWLAHAVPDEPFRRLLAARTKLRSTARSLIADWEDKQRLRAADATAAAPAAPPPLSPPPATEAADADADTAGATATPGSLGATAVEPGSFLGLILAARDKTTGQALDDDEVAAQAQLFILAGYETTANALTFAVYFVARYPEVERRLLAEIDEVLGPDRAPTEADLPRLPYTEAVVYEALRLLPPAYATTRELATSAIEVGGHQVPRGTPLILGIYGSHHDPGVWPRAEEFIPERFMPTSPLYPEVCSRVPNANAPFGYGSRMCIGWKFAVQEGKVALARLYQRLRFELEPGQVPLATAAALTLAPRDGLWVRPVARHHHLLRGQQGHQVQRLQS
ncbi:hypothetical protein PLESTB_000733600 [Pleodorina starrii]|uniref:Cytochrome P450 n=1 Tax=Pleodorina starrii TaxID=330485 RepID=A0A9W6F1M5_9CHLO|nr:hypothetical protein PLESTB_000733600 [Pleodorina starrii]GLC67192.1 hypothetical protein PLESTF_000527600 [Pleodorina starrii]